MNCRHKHENEVEFVATDYISGEEFTVKKCTSCGLSFTDVSKHPVTDTKYYPNDYYGNESRYSRFFAAIADYFVRRRTKHLKLTNYDHGRALDIGCGQGWWLKQMTNKGWECKGVEVSNQAAFHAQEVLQLDILVGEDATKRLESATFDVICLWHVLEHVADPEAILNEVNRLLSDNGQLLLGVPNYGSIEARFGREAWFHLDVPRHLIHFNQTTLSNLLDECGLRTVKTTYFVPEYDFYSFVQTIQNKLGFDMNLLYRLLRRGDLSHSESAKSSVWQILGVLVTLPILTVVSLFWVPIAIMNRQGSSLVLIVEKNR